MARREPHVKVDAPGRFLRDARWGIGLVLKQAARLLYLSPLLIVAKLVLLGVNREASDMVVVVFVLLVLGFFVLLNLYVFWSLVVHFGAKGQAKVVLPFRSSGEAVADPPKVASKNDRIHTVGTIRRLDGQPNEDPEVLRDFWATEVENPWRLVEVSDFAIVSQGEQPRVIHFNAAPLVIAAPEERTLTSALASMSRGLRSVFDMNPAINEDRGDPTQWLSLSEGDNVEIMGVVREEIPNLQRFKLGDRLCSLSVRDGGGLAPYRGGSGEPGRLLVATAKNPMWIRKL